MRHGELIQGNTFTMTILSFIFVTGKHINQNYFCVMQFVPIVPGLYKGEALGGSILQRGMKGAGQVVCSIDWIVNQ